MKKLAALLFLALVHSLVFGQINKIIPPDPNVATLGKYAIHPVNSYTGIPNIDIPIYTIKSGTLTVPISLSYHSGGIRLNEESGRVGLGWALNAGGVITRTIEHKDDLGTYGRLVQGRKFVPDHPVSSDGYFYPNYTNRLLSPHDGCKFMINGVSTEVPDTIINEQDEYDLAPDTFYYNFNGMSGSFILDEQGNGFMHEKKPLKIESVIVPPANTNKRTFKITTETGDIYTFEKLQYTEFHDAANNYISTWLLSEIQSANNDKVTFVYTSPSTWVWPLKTFRQVLTFKNNYLNSAGPDTFLKTILLSEIHFNTGKLVFNYSEKDERKDIKDDFFVKQIDVLAKKGNVFSRVKKIDLAYTYFGKPFTMPPSSSFSITNTGDYGRYSNNGRVDLNLRLRLNSITENDKKVHSFEYHGDDLNVFRIPNKTFMGQDYWGFYNGKTNRTSFIPIGATIDADRTSHPEHAKLFTLKKITYPTKGYTSFEHELHTFDGASSVTGNAAVPTFTTRITETANSNGDGESVVKFTPVGVIHQQTIEIKMNHIVYNYPCGSGFPRNMAPSEMYVELIRPDGKVIRSTFKDLLDPTNPYSECVSVVVSKNLPLEDFINGEYTLRAYFDDRGGELSGYNSISVTYKSTKAIDEEGNTKKYAAGGGLRIKSITNYDHTNTQLSKKVFNYHEKNEDNKEYSFGKLTAWPDHIIGRATALYILSHVTGANQAAKAQSSSSNSLSTDQGSYVTYRQVEEFDTDENGKPNGKTVSKYYNLFNRYNPIIELYPGLWEHYWYIFPTIKIPVNGLMYEQATYTSNTDNTFTKIRTLENQYLINDHEAKSFSYDDTFRNPNMIMGGIYEEAIAEVTVGTGGSPDPGCIVHKFQFYPHYSNLIQLTGTKETVFDVNGENPIINEQKFYYDNDNHLQVTRSETIDSNGDVFETKTYYPDDITSVNALAEGGSLSSSEYQEISKLKRDNLHRIATPVQTVTKRNNSTISVQRNLFSNYNSLVLPSETKTAKSTRALESRMKYHSYNEKGFPLEIIAENDRFTSYIWGYNQEYPIAKIENASYAQIAQALGITEATLKNYNETHLSILNGLRNNTAMPNAMITTYTYNPLIGITSITDPKGYTMYYEYDTLNRLKAIKDATGNLVSENVYHYKDEN